MKNIFYSISILQYLAEVLEPLVRSSNKSTLSSASKKSSTPIKRTSSSATLITSATVKKPPASSTITSSSLNRSSSVTTVDQSTTAVSGSRLPLASSSSSSSSQHLASMDRGLKLSAGNVTPARTSSLEENKKEFIPPRPISQRKKRKKVILNVEADFAIIYNLITIFANIFFIFNFMVARNLKKKVKH